ncbi:hypothetical protein CDO73_12855 [Saccharibacillus sp. O23]|uniref:AraC family transcriptional regulator n=1 Tax=Saccharibacillus sp. O23 TaxID=2009338 RepID=UPI000B4DF609|nr:ABC transporter substrate-binding protein [Saccharibacillus sp. O23]OWR29961.1 hypothetical protein CDO73_12855 [Saccharibacillus sp. O23]
MNGDEQIRLWANAAVKLQDVRIERLEADGGERDYRLPASAFVMIRQGKLRLRLDDWQTDSKRNQWVHGGKGARLRMSASEDCEYMLVLYRGELMLPLSKRLRRQLEEANPFAEQYAFDPLFPAELSSLADRLFEDWQSGDPLDKLRARAVFATFQHELMRQRRLRQEGPERFDLLHQVLLDLHRRCGEPVTLEELARRFGCSVSLLSKSFKRRLNASPMRVLTHMRMERAADELSRYDLSFQQLAERCGYPDAHSFGRAFKKHYGIPPVRYKALLSQGLPVPELPALYPKSALVGAKRRCYNGESVENHYHLSRRGELPMRKRTSAAMVMIALCGVLVLSACSGTGNNTTSSGTAGAAAGAEKNVSAENAGGEASQAATRVYKDSTGDVTVPAEPKRIVDLTGSSIGDLLALGVKPVAAIRDSLQNPYHEGLVDGVADLGSKPTAEVVLAQNPDLIIAFDYIEPSDYEQLRKIAPVVRLKYGALPPQELLTEFGKITGKEAQAQEWIEKWNAKIAEVKPKIQAVVGDRTVSILQPYAKGIYAWGNKGGRGGEILYDDLGLKAPDIIRETLIEGDGFGGDLSLEKLPDYAGDYIFTSNWGWDDGDANVVYDSPVWKSLDAVKNDRVFWIDPKGSFYNDPISLEAQLELIEKSFLGGGA